MLTSDYPVQCTLYTVAKDDDTSNKGVKGLQIDLKIIESVALLLPV